MRAEGAQHHRKFLWAHFKPGGLTMKVSPCPDVSAQSVLHGEVPWSKVLSYLGYSTAQ